MAYLRKINQIASIIFLLAANCFAQVQNTNVTNEQRSPITTGTRGNVNIDYSDRRTFHVSGERIGKKIAIRRLLLLPAPGFTHNMCGADRERCGDTYEGAMFAVDIQSIWPEPVLITASSVEVISPKKNIKLGPGGGGRRVISDRITQNWNPEALLLQPGEVKTFELAQGIRLEGVLGFFDGDVKCDDIVFLKRPFSDRYLGRVKEFNDFMAAKYGERAAVRIKLFERDYKSLLSTVVFLNKGTDFFADGDVVKSVYNVQADGFIGEVLYQLRGGRAISLGPDAPYAHTGQEEDNYRQKFLPPKQCEVQ